MKSYTSDDTCRLLSHERQPYDDLGEFDPAGIFSVHKSLVVRKFLA